MTLNRSATQDTIRFLENHDIPYTLGQAIDGSLLDGEPIIGVEGMIKLVTLDQSQPELKGDSDTAYRLILWAQSMHQRIEPLLPPQ